MRSDRVIFMHIPKAGGQTLISIVGRQYSRNEIINYTEPIDRGALQDRDLSQAKVIMGHLDFGLHGDLPESYKYVTLLRDPVARVVSLYSYIRSNPKHYLHDEVSRQDLGQFLMSEIDYEEVNNGQTRRIAAAREVEVDETTLEIAKSNLRSHFLVSGTVERFDESMLLMKRYLGWRMPFYVKKNVGRGIKANRGLDAKIRHLIRERNRFDEQLYTFADDLLTNQIEDAGLPFRTQLVFFKVFNRLAGSYKNLQHVRERLGRENRNQQYS